MCLVPSVLVPSVLWRCWLGGRKGIRPVKNWVVRCWQGYLSGARCRLAHAQLMPLPLTISCSSKIQIGFTFLVPAHLGSPGQRAVKPVCVLVCLWWLRTLCCHVSWFHCVGFNLFQYRVRKIGWEELFCVEWEKQPHCNMLCHSVNLKRTDSVYLINMMTYFHLTSHSTPWCRTNRDHTATINCDVTPPCVFILGPEFFKLCMRDVCSVVGRVIWWARRMLMTLMRR